jgi:hypothetical protein
VWGRADEDELRVDDETANISFRPWVLSQNYVKFKHGVEAKISFLIWTLKELL